MKLLGEFFDKNDMSALWMRLKQARKASTLSVAEAWESLKGLKGAALQVKEGTLISFLTLPENAWQERFLEVWAL